MKRLAILAIAIIIATVIQAYADDAKARVDQLNGEFQALQMQLDRLKTTALDYDAKALGEKIQAIQRRAAEIQVEAKPLLEQLKPVEQKEAKKADKPKK